MRLDLPTPSSPTSVTRISRAMSRHSVTSQRAERGGEGGGSSCCRQKGLVEVGGQRFSRGLEWCTSTTIP